jgi:hypothetical protein
MILPTALVSLDKTIGTISRLTTIATATATAGSIITRSMSPNNNIDHHMDCDTYTQGEGDGRNRLDRDRSGGRPSLSRIFTPAHSNSRRERQWERETEREVDGEIEIDEEGERPDRGSQEGEGYVCYDDLYNPREQRGDIETYSNPNIPKRQGEDQEGDSLTCDGDDPNSSTCMSIDCGSLRRLSLSPSHQSSSPMVVNASEGKGSDRLEETLLKASLEEAQSEVSG